MIKYGIPQQEIFQKHIFFLIFLKATYAVSCGSNLNEIDRDKICHAIESFENISVRENATRDFLEAHSHKNVKTVLDPTFTY